jgi:hypothetical protein
MDPIKSFSPIVHSHEVRRTTNSHCPLKRSPRSTLPNSSEMARHRSARMRERILLVEFSPLLETPQIHRSHKHCCCSILCASADFIGYTHKVCRIRKLPGNSAGQHPSKCCRRCRDCSQELALTGISSSRITFPALSLKRLSLQANAAFHSLAPQLTSAALPPCRPALSSFMMVARGGRAPPAGRQKKKRWGKSGGRKVGNPALKWT